MEEKEQEKIEINNPSYRKKDKNNKEVRTVKFRSSAEHGTLKYNVPQALYIKPGTEVIACDTKYLSKKEQKLEEVVEKVFMYKGVVIIKLVGISKTYLRKYFKVKQEDVVKENFIEAKVEEEKFDIPNEIETK